jgi:hypothetical protein
MLDKSDSIYMPVRLSRQAVEKLDLIIKRQLCATRAEAIRRVIADHVIPPCFSGGGRTEDAGPSEDAEAA